MLRPLLIVAALVVVLLASAIAAASARSSADELHTLIAAPPECAAPCWQNIRVGVTRGDDAYAILAAHPWVTALNRRSDMLIWQWSGAQSALIDAASYGLIGVEGGIVQTLRLQTRVRFGEVWAMLGAPDSALLIRQPLSRISASQVAAYEAAGWQVIHSLACPVTPRAYWESTVTLAQGRLWTTETLNGRPFSIYDAPGWWADLRRCRQPGGLGF